MKPFIPFSSCLLSFFWVLHIDLVFRLFLFFLLFCLIFLQYITILSGYDLSFSYTPFLISASFSSFAFSDTFLLRTVFSFCFHFHFRFLLCSFHGIWFLPCPQAFLFPRSQETVKFCIYQRNHLHVFDLAFYLRLNSSLRLHLRFFYPQL